VTKGASTRDIDAFTRHFLDKVNADKIDLKEDLHDRVKDASVL
jgi:hypothetical protein